MSNIARSRIWGLAVVVAGVLILAGCKDSRRLPSEEWSANAGPVTINGVVLDEKAEPSAVATAMLDLLKRCREIRGRGLRDPQRSAEFEEVRGQIHRLAAAESIFDAAIDDPHRLMPKTLSREKAVEIVTNNWPAVVAYYIDGVNRGTVIQQIESPTHAVVTARATSPRDREVVDRITRALADQRMSSGEPLKAGTETYNEELKRRAIAEGVSPPIETKIVLSLVRESGYWRVAGVRCDPLVSAVGATAKRPVRQPTTQPSSPG